MSDGDWRESWREAALEWRRSRIVKHCALVLKHLNALPKGELDPADLTMAAAMDLAVRRDAEKSEKRMEARRAEKLRRRRESSAT